MATWNKQLESLSLHDIEKVSERYLMGWHDLSQYGFRVKGLNRKRREHGLDELSKDWSLQYRIDYIQRHFAPQDIDDAITDYLKTHRVADDRWSGIELLDCRFGPEYAKAFKSLLGNQRYRKVSENYRREKLVATQASLYGGVGLANANALAKAKVTNLKKYGTENVMQSEMVKQTLADTNQLRYGGRSPFSSTDVQNKAKQTRMENIETMMMQYKEDGIINDAVFKKSPYELIVFYELIERFGKQDVLYQYGLHPYDKRYPYACDFYIKSLDLFIEINAHYSHGNHWYDANHHEDVARRTHLLAANSRKSQLAVKTWCVSDVEKRTQAKASGIRYLVFWDGTQRQENHKKVPNLTDFYDWLIGYNADYDQFIKNHPENTY